METCLDFVHPCTRFVGGVIRFWSWIGWCLFVACLFLIRCRGLLVVQVHDLCHSWILVYQLLDLGFFRCLVAERIIGQANFYRVLSLGFTVVSPSAASGLLRLGEAGG
ncbi:hypothetical protein IGI04_031904 [Brassica rapa subsp. trilocularis]|uniref:Uncharacterized protein n=1 Tax=Brassica rapa subsp. trilocularis TaxID=1813537 RepID=A0ABQ7LUX0_BRACM|nr:hypothetical protein IGI04_031904 [Brassica rapa subsp. trilocularis]